MKSLLESAKRLGDLLRKQNKKITTAESCTGGQLAYIFTSIPGSSTWFERGFVTYSNESKEEMLGIPSHIIAEHGAVSEETVKAMAQGALDHSHAEWSVGITGIAGPDGGTPEKPVGMVWISIQQKNNLVRTKCCRFDGGRLSIRTQVVEAVLEDLLKMLI